MVVRWSEDNHNRHRGDADAQVGGVCRLCRFLLGRLAAMECQALPAYLISTKETLVTQPLSIRQADHLVTDIARYPGAVSVRRIVGAKSSWVLSKILVLQTAGQRLIKSWNF